jgi:hypothetical protein
MVFGPYHVTYRNRSHEDAQESDVIGSARELYEAGIHFKKSNTNYLDDISFVHGVLSLPQVCVDDSTEYMLLNMMCGGQTVQQHLEGHRDRARQRVRSRAF